MLLIMRRWTQEEIDLKAADLERAQLANESLMQEVAEQALLYGEFGQILEGRVFRICAERGQKKIRVEKVRHAQKV